ncbi:MarR family transcriptional regulator [Aquincola sp. S2]|uniref:MarR family transcriptional regulator n=1 Tax=Pseudaquabacterium terrae TaxID=2732868 RepID=A0ABX2ETL2_9BURK|nr:MarR family transcriptional regulator [Aquabacterium terrae]NRF72092.1 MarR family transcriptional regulator [Aquabacterium terrae]
MSLEKFYSRPGHLIRRLNQISMALFAEETQPLDLTSVQYAALNMIQEVPGIDQASLSNMIAFDKTTIVKVLDRLVDKQLITRTRSETDRRVNHLNVTGKGTALLKEIHPMLDRSDKRILAPLSEADQRKFMEMLSRLVQVNNIYSRAPLDTSLQEDLMAKGRKSRGAARKG